MAFQLVNFNQIIVDIYSKIRKLLGRINTLESAVPVVTPAILVYEYTTPGAATLDVPLGVTQVEIVAVGGGGGGGSGRKGAAGTLRYGGSGGQGGHWGLTTVDGSLVEGQTLNITVGAGGNGGASRTTNSTSGANGTAGGSTFVTVGGVDIIRTSSVAQGLGGTATGPTTASRFTGLVMYNGAAGGVPFNGSIGNDSAAPLNLEISGGGSGGTITTGNNEGYAGGAQADYYSLNPYVNTDYVDGAVGANAVLSSFALVGKGGNGGAAGLLVNAGTGGAGIRGGGGGGGGAAVDDVSNSGAGGRGGDGYVRISLFF